jgi:hypothetical protein
VERLFRCIPSKEWVYYPSHFCLIPFACFSVNPGQVKVDYLPVTNSATVNLYSCQFSPIASFNAVYIGSKSILGATVSTGLAGLAGVPFSVGGVAKVVINGRGLIVVGAAEPL